MPPETMHTNVNLAAPVGVVLLLGTGLLLLILLMLLPYAIVSKRLLLAKVNILALLVIAVVYLAAMLVFSLKSQIDLVSRGQEKYFCEIDCHLAYSIANVVHAKSIGNAPYEIEANGEFCIVTIRTRFDENTIGANRDDSELFPNPRVVTIVDESGARYSPSTHMSALARQPSDKAISTPLRPADSYNTTYVFDLPASIGDPVLLINEGDWITRLIIGHENSLAHKKTLFQI
jgi:hypothetical protein